MLCVLARFSPTNLNTGNGLEEITTSVPRHIEFDQLELLLELFPSIVAKNQRMSSTVGLRRRKSNRFKMNFRAG